jgi:transcription initiation factor IIE alpha subunit
LHIRNYPLILERICSTIKYFQMDTPHKLDTSNPDHLLYRNGMLDIAILGGIRLEGLDRMRVTLKIQIEHLAIRHNLDLYNDTQVEKLIRKVADKLEVGTSVIGAALNELTELLEQHRLGQIEKQNTQQHEKKKILTHEEQQEARVYLSAPNLIERTREDIGKAGVIGEEMNRLLMYLIFTSRKRENPLHIISLGSSGIGKTHLQEKVSALIPDEDKMESTSLTASAIYYFGRYDLRHKVLLFEDLDGAMNALFPIRELQSKRKIIRTVPFKNTKGETKSIQLIVEGPVSIAGCTTKESIYEDNANRSFLIYIDESKEQDEKVMEYQRKFSAGKIDVVEQQKIINAFQNMQRMLQPVQVRNPFAEFLKIPEEVFKPRRTNAHYLAFIELITFYHQYQREKKYDKETGEEFIETTLEDIAEANKLMKEILLRKSDELNGACRSYFEKLKEYLNEKKQSDYTNSEIRQHMRIKGTTLRRYHNELLGCGLIKIKQGKKNTGYSYEVSSYEEYEKLHEHINGMLDEILNKLRTPAPNVSHPQNGSPKKKNTSKLSAVSQ